MSLWSRLFGKSHAIGSAPNITGNFNLTANLGDQTGRGIAVAGYIYADESKEQLEYRIDILQEIIERQKTRAEIPMLEAKREQMVMGMKQARDVLNDLERKQREGSGLSSQERLNMRNLGTNIEKMKEEVEKGSQAIAEARLKAGVAG